MKTVFHADIVEALDRSGIQVSDRELWLGLLEAQSETLQVVFLNIFYGHENLLPAMTENLRLKIKAQEDTSKVQSVFEQEKSIFEDLMSDKL
jgi:hypothetical protein